MNPTERIPGLIRDLYSIVRELENLFPERRFTPDGHLVGSIGEVLAAYHYDLQLLPGSAETHDARTAPGKLVQIKATQRRGTSLSSEPEHLLVLRILPNGRTREVFNGPGNLAWARCGKMQKNGQRPVSLSTLEELMGQVHAAERLTQVVPLESSDAR